MTRFALIFLLAAANTAVPAFAEVIDGLTFDRLRSLLVDAGLNPEMSDPESRDAPYATMESGEYKFFAQAAKCDENSCTTLYLFANFDLNRDITLEDYRAVNFFNDQEIIGRAYINTKERQVGVDLVLDLRGGVETNYMRLKLEHFPALIQVFVDKYREAMKSNN